MYVVTGILWPEWVLALSDTALLLSADELPCRAPAESSVLDLVEDGAIVELLGESLLLEELLELLLRLEEVLVLLLLLELGELPVLPLLGE